MQDYLEDSSGAWVFPPSAGQTLAEENAKLKTLLASILAALPADVTRKIPDEHMKAVTGDGSN